MSNKVLIKVGQVDKISFAKGEVRALRNNYVGRVLTIIDATITDPIQKKAIKRLITSAIWEKEWYTANIVNYLMDKDVVEGSEPLIGDDELFVIPEN